MNIDECIDRLKGYGYAVNISPWPGRLYMDGYGLRLGLTAVNDKTVTEIDCYLKNGESVECLVGTTSVYPKYLNMKCVDGIGMDEMFSVLSEPGKAAMRLCTMKLERELGVLEG